MRLPPVGSIFLWHETEHVDSTVLITNYGSAMVSKVSVPIYVAGTEGKRGVVFAICDGTS